MFYKKLRNLRKQNNMSQEDLAHKLDISRQSVSKWESGLSMPDLDNVIKLSEMFNVSLDYLLKDTKSDSDFHYYTVDTKEKKAMSSINTYAMIFITIAIAMVITLLIIPIFEPHNYYNGNTGRSYDGFIAYFLVYLEYRIVFISAILMLVIAIFTLLIPDKTLIKFFMKKSVKNK